MKLRLGLGLLFREKSATDFLPSHKMDRRVQKAGSRGKREKGMQPAMRQRITNEAQTRIKEDETFHPDIKRGGQGFALNFRGAPKRNLVAGDRLMNGFEYSAQIDRNQEEI